MFEPVTDHKSLVEFYVENGLETSADPESEGAFYSIAELRNGSPTAAATLSFRQGVFILDYIAVDPSFRGKNLGKKALELVKQKAITSGADCLYITTKAPLFFEKLGFVLGEPKGLDLNTDCKDCPQLNVNCHPKNMKLFLKD